MTKNRSFVSRAMSRIRITRHILPQNAILVILSRPENPTREGSENDIFPSSFMIKHESLKFFISRARGKIGTTRHIILPPSSDSSRVRQAGWVRMTRKGLLICRYMGQAQDDENKMWNLSPGNKYTLRFFISWARSRIRMTRHIYTLSFRSITKPYHFDAFLIDLSLTLSLPS